MEITGNITTDLKLERTSDGVPYVKFQVAQGNYKMRDGERIQDASLFFSVTAWWALAEGIVESLKKGSPVVGVGHWDASDYKTKQGEKRHAQWVVADALGPDLRRCNASVTRRQAKADTKADATTGKKAPAGADENPFDES